MTSVAAAVVVVAAETTTTTIDETNSDALQASRPSTASDTRADSDGESVL